MVYKKFLANSPIISLNGNPPNGNLPLSRSLCERFFHGPLVIYTYLVFIFPSFMYFSLRKFISKIGRKKKGPGPEQEGKSKYEFIFICFPFEILYVRPACYFEIFIFSVAANFVFCVFLLLSFPLFHALV